MKHLQHLGFSKFMRKDSDTEYKKYKWQNDSMIDSLLWERDTMEEDTRCNLKT